MLPKIDERTLIQGMAPSDPDYLIVQSRRDLERLCREIFGDRDTAVVGVTLRVRSREPVLRAADIRELVGVGVRIFLIPDEDLVFELGEMLGPRLRLGQGAVRIWWPGASALSDARDHPVVVALDGEEYEGTLEELAREFDLSRPGVRERVRLIEDARAMLEHEVERAVQQSRLIDERLRDAKIECHEQRTRAEAAEAELAAMRRTPPA
jgi:hypothetical protein